MMAASKTLSPLPHRHPKKSDCQYRLVEGDHSRQRKRGILLRRKANWSAHQRFRQLRAVRVVPADSRLPKGIRPTWRSRTLKCDTRLLSFWHAPKTIHPRPKLRIKLAR